MRRALLLGWLVPLVALADAPLADPAALLAKGDAAYQAGDYAAAADAYRAVTEAGFASVDAWFNLGTAELKAGRRGAAILAFERALRLDPHDADAQFNLAEAAKGNIDRIVGAREEEPLVERLGARIPAEPIGLAFVIAWVAGLALLLLRRFVGVARGLLLALGLTGILGAVVLGGLLATAWWHRTQAAYAVVVSPSVPVREGPAADFKSAFEIHEGLKVRVVKRERGFLRVRLPNGTEGWVAERDVPTI